MPIIVIDPGHGGENRGGEYGEFVEKEINPIVAEAMKEHLEKFEDVTVYLTHEVDMDMTIKDRVAYAKEKNADFLYCLHFNLSVNHNLYGAEVWVPSRGELYSKGFAFAEIEMQELTDMGLFSRGIKTRLNDRGTDYYGILRYAAEMDVPCALIEHCHLDHAKDAFAVADGEESLKALGICDAEAVAKYFGLKSEELGIDYSGYPVSQIPVPADIARPDETEPEVNEIELTSIDQETGMATIHMTTSDSDSYIQYYAVSTDGGNTYSELLEWPRPEQWDVSAPEYTFTFQLPFDTAVELRTMAYNEYDKFTESNTIGVGTIEDPERLRQEMQQQKAEELLEKQQTYTEVTAEAFASHTDPVTTAKSNGYSIGIMASIAGIVLLMLILLMVLIRNLRGLLRHKKRK